MNRIYDIITILPLSLLSVMLSGQYAGIPEHSFSGSCFCLIFTLFLILLRNMKRKERLLSIGIAAFFLAGLFLAAGAESRQLFLTDYFWIIRIAGISAAAFLAGILMNRNIWIRRAAAAAVLVYCIAEAARGRTVGKEPFSLICLMLLVRFAEEIQRTWKKSGVPEMKGHIVRITPFLLAVCLSVYAAPAPDKPYDWQFAKDLYHSCVTLANRIYGSIMHPEDDYAAMGFSDKGSFASRLGTNDEDALFIQADRTSLRDFRLVGSISNEFTGREWLFRSGQANDPRIMDTMETVSAVRQFAPSDRTDYLQKADLHYENRFYNTHYLFSPSKIKLEATKEANYGISEQNGSIVSKKKLKYLDTYTVYCYELNYANPKIAELLTQAEQVREEEWKQTVSAEKLQNQPGYSFADYQEYRRGIYAHNCRSCGVSDAVREILADIENSADNRYDRMKMLEAYLSGMEYDTACGALPDTVSDAGSFLDYFLFTSKKGYCMHFATAFVLMANEMGIPCRYVQGYLAKADRSGRITVKQSSAHAWPEVYFDHVGWVAFEPTPGYAVQSGWAVSSGVPSVSAPDYEAQYRRDALPETDAPSDGNAEEPKHINPLVFMIPALSVLCFLLLFFLVSRAVSKRKYALMHPDEKFRYLAQQILRYFGYLGFRMENETLAEFADRVRHADRPELTAHLGFIPVCEAVLYSDSGVTEDMIHDAEQTCQALRTLVRHTKLRYRLMLLFKK